LEVGEEKMTEQGRSDSNITLIIRTVKGELKKDFPKTAKIAEVIAAVIQHFNFNSEGKYELNTENDPDNPLDPNRPLVSFGLKDGDVLVFTDLGVAV
jgi:hypothetical protein